MRPMVGLFMEVQQALGFTLGILLVDDLLAIRIRTTRKRISHQGRADGFIPGFDHNTILTTPDTRILKLLHEIYSLRINSAGVGNCHHHGSHLHPFDRPDLPAAGLH